VPSWAILVSAVLVLSYRQIDRQTESQTDGITEADDRYTYAITVGVSNEMHIYTAQYVAGESEAHSGREEAECLHSL